MILRCLDLTQIDRRLLSLLWFLFLLLLLIRFLLGDRLNFGSNLFSNWCGDLCRFFLICSLFLFVDFYYFLFSWLLSHCCRSLLLFLLFLLILFFFLRLHRCFFLRCWHFLLGCWCRLASWGLWCWGLLVDFIESIPGGFCCFLSLHFLSLSLLLSLFVSFTLLGSQLPFFLFLLLLSLSLLLC